MKLECGSSVCSMPRDGAVDQPVGLGPRRRSCFDRVQRGGEDLVLVGHLILRDQGAAAEKPPTSAQKTTTNTAAERDRYLRIYTEMYTLVLDPVQIGFL